MRSLITIAFTLYFAISFAQINTFYVQPIKTDAGYSTNQDSHFVVTHNNVAQNKLLLFLGGTGSNTKSYLRICQFAADLGYDVINLAYPNEVAAASQKNATDSLAFDNFRQEICFGTPLSNAVAIDSLNAIHTRVIKLLRYLNTTYPTGSWNKYLTDNTTLAWSKIAIGGHSQGGGHAAFIAKFYDVNRVLMFASPNDYSDHFSQPANWLFINGKTATKKHFAYLSLLDEVVDFNKQLRCLEALYMIPSYDSILVDNNSAPYANSNFLYTKQNPGLAILHHNTPMKFSLINNDVWSYMLTSEVVTHLNNINQKMYETYPNPTHAKVFISFKEKFEQEHYILTTITGQILRKGLVKSANHLSLDLSDFSSGTYILLIRGAAIKLVKD